MDLLDSAAATKLLGISLSVPRMNSSPSLRGSLPAPTEYLQRKRRNCSFALGFCDAAFGELEDGDNIADLQASIERAICLQRHVVDFDRVRGASEDNWGEFRVSGPVLAGCYVFFNTWVPHHDIDRVLRDTGFLAISVHEGTAFGAAVGRPSGNDPDSRDC